MNFLFKDKKYLLACSYGPDSMALFDMLYQEEYSFVVAHVNYHKRDVSDFEEESLRKYCLDRGIEFEVLHASHCPEKRNFQEWARELRYEFFQDCLTKHQCEAVLVAHQQDDLLETYLMQKQRGSYVNYYGIKPVSTLFNIQVIRPLLGYTKQQLLDYDIKHNVPYSIDCSNLTDDYTRNKIRHHIIDKLTTEERNSLLEEIANKNVNAKHIELNDYLDNDSLSVNKIVGLDEQAFALCIYAYLEQQAIACELSKKFIKELHKSLQSKKANITLTSSGYEFVKEYSELYVTTSRTHREYQYVINEPTTLITEEFELVLDNDSSDRNIKLSDYPLTIRNAHSDDHYLVSNNNVVVRRLFIDWKMPKSLRGSWPVIINKDGKIIYIPRFRKEFTDNHKTIFKINTKVLKC